MIPREALIPHGGIHPVRLPPVIPHGIGLGRV
jgi:hypothetical protein